MISAPGPFPRRARIRCSREFQDLSRRGQRRGSEAFVVFSAPTRAEPAGASVGRLGITVSRRVGNAVVRNRLKRRVREWYRHERSALASGLDLVVIARPAAAKLDSAATSEQLTALLETRS